MVFHRRRREKKTNENICTWRHQLFLSLFYASVIAKRDIPEYESGDVTVNVTK
jgi:hypothetical protein